ncbi:prepilin-type N-terminal cleavage/methylation domain-containing protein [Acinetobacter calcoaceticus]|uniref:Prepilin-type N-terminal cleavage/methylation domain-containing protein n=1 Tax=Acinetobacter calcoaceticus TaxID=471 RepID=A0A4R1YA65_ACICA|nr:prepilin-type N-terminal cleavage/methylation domain-containing protein [Acinetobacter calcoaceticus]
MLSRCQQGFSLVELMIALSLGLLIVAAGLSVLMSGHRVLALQVSMDELQHNANLSLGMLTRDLRHTNLNTTSMQQVNNKTKGSGIIFNAGNLPLSMTQQHQNFWTQEGYTEAATDINSDQLTIQYMPEYDRLNWNENPVTASLASNIQNPSQNPNQNPSLNLNQPLNQKQGQSNDVYLGGYNCEGEKIEFNVQVKDAQAYGRKIIVNRYFLKRDPQQHADEPEGFSLYCQSGYYAEGDREITGFKKDGGQQIIKRVDAFKVRFGVKAPNGQLRYLSINQYNALMSAEKIRSNQFYNIVSIELNLLIRASTKLGARTTEAAQRYELAGQTLTLKSNALDAPAYLRQSISQVVALRNSTGAADNE